MHSQIHRLFMVFLAGFGLMLNGCAGEIDTYRFAKEGSEAYNASDYATALEKWQAALEQARNAEDKKTIGDLLYNIGLVYDRLGQYQEALDHYQQSLEVRRKIGDREGEGNTLASVGVVYQNLAQYQKALDHYRQALEIKQEIDDKRGEGSMLNNIGAVYWSIGQYQEALEYYQQALESRRYGEDKQGEGSMLHNIGGIYESQGQYQEALDYYQQALAIRRGMNDMHGAASTLNNIGVVYWRLGQYAIALDYYRQALDIRRVTGDKRGQGYNLNNIGVVYWKLGEYQEALDYYQQALAIRQAIGDKRGEGSTLNNIGKVYEHQERYQEALEYYQHALAIRQTIGDKYGEGSTFTNIGDVYEKLSQYQEALSAFQASIAINTMLGTKDILWMAQRGLAAVEIKLNQPESALKHYEQALDNIETLRAGIEEQEQRVSFMQDKFYVYDELIDLLHALHQVHPDRGYDRKALEIFERKQGRVFLEEMGKSGARLFAGLPESVKQQEDALEIQIEQLTQALADERAETEQDQQRIHQLEQHKQQLQTEQDALQAEIKRRYPDYYALRYPQPAALSDLQNAVLHPEELMLVYDVMQEHTLIWLISSHSMQMYTLAVGTQALQEQIASLRKTMLSEWGTSRGLFTASQPEEQHIPFVHASHALYALLIPEDIRNVLTEPHSLNVVPTGPLYALPFEALVTQPAEDPDTAHYLIEDLPISYLSSASLLKTLREADARRTGSAPYPLLAFAHPMYNFNASQETGTIRSLQAQVYREILGGGLPELPETAEEAEAVANMFNAPNETEPLQLRQDASRERVFAFNESERLDDYQYLLFAMHGVLPGEVTRLTQSALILSDDFLTMGDVFGLRLNAKVVALSACNTGMGEMVRGEGVMGLTRAFMYAGTPAIAVTLWSVESVSAKTLSIGMFQNLKQGAAPAQALRTIKIRMLHGEESPSYKHPYYWAPYVVFGDGM